MSGNIVKSRVGTRLDGDSMYEILVFDCVPVCVALKSGMDKDRSLDRNRQQKNR